MNLNKLLEKKRLFEQEKGNIDAITLSSYEKDLLTEMGELQD